MIRLVLPLVLHHAGLAVMDPTDLTRRLRLLARPVMIAHPGERKDTRACRETRLTGVLLGLARRWGFGVARGPIMHGDPLVAGQEVPAGEGGSAYADERLLLCVCGCQSQQHARDVQSCAPPDAIALRESGEAGFAIGRWGRAGWGRGRWYERVRT